MDPALGWKTLAAAASAHLHHRDLRRDSLFVAGQGGYSQAFGVRSHPHSPAFLPCCGVDHPKNQEAGRFLVGAAAAATRRVSPDLPLQIFRNFYLSTTTRQQLSPIMRVRIF